MRPLTLAYSSCPNDTFIFHALAHKLLKIDKSSNLEITDYSDSLYSIDSKYAPEFEITIADVETLNQHARNSLFDITKLSFATFSVLRNEYALLRTGAALGRGCGPLVVSLPQKKINEKTVIAVPGKGTTAFVLFSLFIKETFPEFKPYIIPMPFEKIMPAVKDGVADFGVIIHEGRFIYQNLGLDCLVDLGEWWERFTGLPIPLGCIAIKRSVYRNDPKLAFKVEQLIRQSIQHAFDHPESGRDYIKAHAQEMDDDVIRQHIHLYVNNFSKDIGDEGEAAIFTFFQKAEEAGIINPSSDTIFAC